MPLTPADIHNMAFKKPPIGKRGYDEEEVDGFLDGLEHELTRLMEENRSLHDRVRHGGTGGTGEAASATAINAEFADVAAQLTRLQEARARAEQHAQSLHTRLEQAREAASAGTIPSGRDDGDARNAGVLMMAQRTADDHMRDATQESAALLYDARSKSEQITSEAQLKAGTIEGDARRAHADAMNSLESRREALLDEIDRLSRLAQSYQAALNSHVTQQLQDLNSVSAPVAGELG